MVRHSFGALGIRQARDSWWHGEAAVTFVTINPGTLGTIGLTVGHTYTQQQSRFIQST